MRRLAEELPMSLARALQVKNRIAGEIKAVQGRVQANNSYRVDRPPEYDALDDFKAWQGLVDDLIRIKTAIAKANIEAGLYEKIVRRDELKGMLTFARNIPTLKGKHDASGGYYGRNDEEKVRELEYACKMDRKQVDALIETFERELDLLQQELARLNHETKITEV